MADGTVASRWGIAPYLIVDDVVATANYTGSASATTSNNASPIGGHAASGGSVRVDPSVASPHSRKRIA